MHMPFKSKILFKNKNTEEDGFPPVTLLGFLSHNQTQPS